MYLRITPKTFDNIINIWGVKKVCQEHDSTEKEIIVLGHSY